MCIRDRNRNELSEISSFVKDGKKIIVILNKIDLYSKSELKEPIIGTTVVYEDKLLVGVSSILMRDIYNIPRIMNRYYYNDGSRGMIPKNFTGKIRGTSVEMIDQQVESWLINC